LVGRSVAGVALVPPAIGRARVSVLGGSALALAIAFFAPATAAALPSGCTQSGTTVTCTYTSGGEHQFVVPSAVTSVTATAVGAEGGNDFGFNNPGGLGASATGTIGGLTSGQVLFVEVGILGGAAGHLVPSFADSGAGGGESDVRSCPSTGNQPCPAGSTLASRLLVAGGGGGRGDFGGTAGDAGTPAPGGDALANGVGKHGGGVGTGGTATAPGSGGAGCDGGGNGAPGAAAGGAGGDAGAANGQNGVSGGGGGAGWFGAGAGGGCVNSNDDGGSGGGGSSHAASSLTGVSFSQAAGGQQPSVTITYTALGVTTMTLPGGMVGQGYSTNLAAGGGTAPFTWSLSDGSLPNGLHLSSGGTISGTPQAAGTSNFSVQVTDSGSPQQTTTQTFSIEINKASTITELEIDPTSAAVGDTITLSADILPIPGGGPLPGGTVTFTVNGSTVCNNVPATGGFALCTISLNTAGTYSITAAYSGDSNYTASSDTNGSYQVRKAGARPSLTATPSSGATAATPVTLAVHLQTNGFADAPTGTVDFDVDGTTAPGCGSVPVTNLSATCSVFIAAGSHTLDATYSGDSEYVSTETQITNYVATQADPAVSMSASPDFDATAATPVSLTVSVSGAAGAVAPTGTVAFTVDGLTASGCGSVTVTSGSATCAVGFLTPGFHNFTATYGGDANYSSGSAGIFLYPVGQASPAVGLSASPSSGATPATPVSLTATVSGPAGGGPDPTGTVDFTIDGTSVSGCGSITVTAGSASCAAGTLAPGDHTLAVFYSGDGNYVPGSASISHYVVTKATPTIGTSTQPASATVGSSIADKATVSGGSNPSGTVTFNLYDNPNGTGTPLFTDTEPLSGGSATSQGYTATAPGTDYWVATYNGDANDNSVTSGTALEPVSIAKASPSIVTSQQPASAGWGSLIADQATVTGGFNPSGTVTFSLYNNPNGTGTPLFTDTEPLSGGGASSKAYVATTAGTDYWVATYNGDGNNNSVTSGTGLEPVTITYSTTVSGVRNGTLTVARGQSVLIAPGARITGGVNVQAGGSVDIEGATVNGSLTASGAGSIRACGSSFSGAVTITGAGGQVTFGDGGTCAGNKISGTVSVTGGAGTGVTFVKNTITGSLTITHNKGTITVAANNVGGSTKTTPNP
jgi:hypothetical protein